METSETKLIQIVLNGHPREVPEGLALDALLAFLEVKPDRVAIERNRSIVRKPDWPETKVEAGDQLEIVWFVGGGSE
jgi:thiamine biosynthesis protein ThiS